VSNKLPFCACGCGERVVKIRNRYILYHPWNRGIPYVPRPKQREVMKKRYKENPGVFVPSFLGKHHSKESKMKMSQNKERAKKTSNGLRGKPKSEEHKKNIAKGERRFWKNLTDEERENKIRKIRSVIKPTRPERQLNSLLNKWFPKKWKYVGDCSFFLGGKCPDFRRIDGKEQLIELFGRYWHKKEDIKTRQSHFKKYGVDTLIVWDDELGNVEELFEKIKLFMYKISWSTRLMTNISGFRMLMEAIM